MGKRGVKKKYSEKILLSITAEQKQRIEHFAEMRRETVSGFVRSTLHKYCDYLEKKENKNLPNGGEGGEHGSN